MSQWHYTINGQQQPGTTTWEALQGLAANGSLQGNDMVWTEGMGDWAQASTVANLFPAAPAVAPFPGQAPLPYQQPPGYNYGYLPYSNQAAPYAGFWLRFCAAFIDGIILWVVGAIFTLLFTGELIITGRHHVDPGISLLLNVISIVLGWLYSALQESSAAQATLGKRAVGIKVTDMAGERLTFGRATGRHFAKLISMIILFIGYIMAGFTERKQALHDMIASTLVVQKV